MNSVTANRGQSDYFQLFDLAASFTIDLNELEQRYYALQQSIHPDRFAVATEAERQWAVHYAAKINDGYRVLKDPLQRAIYLLALDQQPVDFEHDTINDSEFLQQQMMLRERIDQAYLLPQLAVDIKNQIKFLEHNLTNLFADKQKDYENIKSIVTKLRFFNKLQQQINQQVGQT